MMMKKLMHKKEKFVFLALFFLASPIFAEEYVPTQAAVTILSEVKDSIANLPADLSLSSGTIDSLIAKCEGVIETDEKYVDSYVYLSICHLMKKEFNPAIQAAEKIVAFNSVNPDGYFLRGFAYFVSSLEGATTSFAKAIPDFEKVIFLNPEYKSPEAVRNKAEVSDIQFWKALCYAELGEFGKAKEILTDLVEKYPESRAAESARHELKRSGYMSE